MNADKQGEILSALMDGESTELELRQLLVALDDAACERWSRWHLVQDVLKGQACMPQMDASFSARIQMAIAEAPLAQPQRHWMRSLSRVAVAASVALAVVAGWQMWQQTGGAGVASGQNLAANASFSQATPVSLDLQVAPPQVRYSYTQPDLLRAQPVADTFAISRDEFNRMMMARRNSAAANTQTVSYGRLVDFPVRSQR